jgi:uncharacterized membrane protein (UPF0127 family)
MASSSVNMGPTPFGKSKLQRPVLLLLLLLTLVTACSSPAPVDEKTQAVSLNGHPFVLELAITPEARFQGLSDRKSIADDGGMLFVFPEAKIMQFVMRKCYVPIDIIFLGQGGRIVKMHEMTVVPYDTSEDDLHRYSSEWPAQYALEIKGGTLKSLALKEGDKIDLPYQSLTERAK